MSHTVIITGNGTGPGGTSEGRIEWKPSHDLPANEERRRIEKATRMLDRLNDFLYGDGGDGPDPGP